MSLHQLGACDDEGATLSGGRSSAAPSTQKLGRSSICCQSVTSLPVESIHEVGRPCCLPADKRFCSFKTQHRRAQDGCNSHKTPESFYFLVLYIHVSSPWGCTVFRLRYGTFHNILRAPKWYIKHTYAGTVQAEQESRQKFYQTMYKPFRSAYYSGHGTLEDECHSLTHRFRG